MFYGLLNVCLFCPPDRSMRSSLRFDSCRLSAPITASRWTLPPQPGSRLKLCSLTRRGKIKRTELFRWRFLITPCHVFISSVLICPHSYERSRELEPPVDPCPNSPNSWSCRLLANKLTLYVLEDQPSKLSLATDCKELFFWVFCFLCRMRTSHSDQISVSSSGSSGSDLEDLSIPHPSPFRLKLKVKEPKKSCLRFWSPIVS